MKPLTKPLKNCEITISSGSIQVENGVVQYGEVSYVVCSKELPKFRNELTRNEMRRFLRTQLPSLDEKTIKYITMGDYYIDLLRLKDEK